ESCGRSAGVAYSAEGTCTPSLLFGRKIHPSVLDAPSTQACTLEVTLTVWLPSAIGALPAEAPNSSACTPASPPKLFQVVRASLQSTLTRLMSPVGATPALNTLRVRVAEVMVAPAGICPGPGPRMPSKRMSPNSRDGAGSS